MKTVLIKNLELGGLSLSLIGSKCFEHHVVSVNDFQELEKQSINIYILYFIFSSHFSKGLQIHNSDKIFVIFK